MANWDQLLPELLTMIVKKVDIYEDFVAFGGVCRSWRSVAVKENFNQQLVSSSSSPYSVVQPPWLMLAEKRTETDVREFVNVSKGGMSKKIALPEAKGKWCIGSMGWLITIDEEGVELLHPLNRTRISLPQLVTFRTSPMKYIYGATLSASPSATDDYAVMIALGFLVVPVMLAFWTPGNPGWTFVETCYPIYDVTYHKDKFYAINSANYILVCDVRVPDPRTEIVGALPPHFATENGGQAYLTECCGDLLAVVRILFNPSNKDDDSYRTTGFSICKPVDDDESSTTTSSFYKWQEVNDLGGASIFVGHNTSICVPSAAAVGVKPNCVYFTDDYVNGYAFADSIIGGTDMGIYNLATGAFEPLYRETSLSNYCPPIWVLPSF